MDDKTYGLLFDIRRSMRYHDRRAAFHETMHKTTCVLTAFMASSMFLEVTRMPAILAMSAATFAILDLVLDYSGQASKHRTLKGEFAELELKLVNDLPYKEGLNERLAIEKGEPPIYRALDAICYNELLVAEGADRSHEIQVNWIKRLTCQLWKWNGWQVA